ncbi:hypothetical protein JQ557_17190 [Bradyrhizobium sp. U87765 SZCCT0131]|uniref:hypothetical protein n=1 Tax=unclassified Bradyrhizobium TaxID=2631580 RepID=UPI001BA4BDC7|nr:MULTISPECIES: hypothetical protein [unclassified Bradyrhizobium]MBR1219746.1 hypothetical protein [Bradyrhizobium sp. U87765 SZCCT0131]MBR1262397.1 hypothetical protein [Bradyrhizobium sp. U87765 SZCCT0134]MBR1308420.1 hypothetical protein [Bradyrhizobium sp. U87765 SZCCT0110]MBR1318179.1 hypothetical protein [Bradyrhizobium sp. U87765 SZCCT0109]MBR1351882.1 hypothetical protein [Bradyrhizobium sp. U87765 SZCCT0048]
MVTDFSIKPVGAPVASPVVKPQPDAAKQAVPTDLPPPKSTTAADGANAARNNTQQPDTSHLSSQVMIDRAAGEIVYRVVDNRTSLVVRQYPEEARLRARAYLRAEDEAKRTHTRVRLDQTA